MLCPKCGTDVGSSITICTNCAEEQEKAFNTSVPSLDFPTLQSEEKTEVEVTTDDGEIIYAGFWNRFFAMMLDAAVYHVLIYALIFTFTIPAPEEIQQYSVQLTLFLSLFSLSFYLYYPLMESSRYQATLGKLAFGIYVSNIEGQRIGFWKAFGRNFAKLLSALPLNIGFLFAAFTGKKQALHDIMTNCLVLSHPNIPFGRKLLLSIFAVISPILIPIILYFNLPEEITNKMKLLSDEQVTVDSGYKISSNKNTIKPESTISYNSQPPLVTKTEPKVEQISTSVEVDKEVENSEFIIEKIPTGNVAAVAINGKIVSLKDAVIFYHKQYRRLEIGLFPLKVTNFQLDILKRKRAIAKAGVNNPSLIVNIGFEKGKKFKRKLISFYNATFSESSLGVSSSKDIRQKGFLEVDKTGDPNIKEIISIRGNRKHLKHLKLHDKAKHENGTNLEWMIDISKLPVFEVG